MHSCNKILKITDYVKLLNCIFVKNVLARDCLSNFQGTFKLANFMHQHHTRHAANNSVILKQSQTQFYGIHSIEYQAASFWNTLQKQVNIDLLQESCHKTKDTLTRHFLKIINTNQKNLLMLRKVMI